LILLLDVVTIRVAFRFIIQHHSRVNWGSNFHLISEVTMLNEDNEETFWYWNICHLILNLKNEFIPFVNIPNTDTSRRVQGMPTVRLFARQGYSSGTLLILSGDRSPCGAPSRRPLRRPIRIPFRDKLTDVIPPAWGSEPQTSSGALLFSVLLRGEGHWPCWGCDLGLPGRFFFFSWHKIRISIINRYLTRHSKGIQ
jgi:hypothetical protein